MKKDIYGDVYPKSIKLPQKSIELYSNESITLTYQLENDEYGSGYKVINDTIKTFGGEDVFDITIKNDSITFRAKVESAGSAGTIWFYGSQEQYLGKISYKIKSKPYLNYIVLEKDSVTLSAPIKGEINPTTRVDFKIINLEGNEARGNCSWSWYSSNENVAIVENVWGIVTEGKITASFLIFLKKGGVP